MDSASASQARLEKAQRYQYGALAIYTIAGIASSVICLMSLCSLRRWGDPTRRFLRWQKATSIILPLSLYCVVISWATAVASLQLILDNDFDGYGLNRVLDLVTSYVGAIAAFVMEVATVCAFLTLVSLGFCIATAADDTTPQNSRNKMAKYGAYAVSGLIVCLQVVVLGLSITADTFSQVIGDSGRSYRNYYVQSNRITLVCYVFLMLLSLAVTVWAFLIKFRGFAAKVKTPSTYFIVCGVLLLLRTTYAVASFASVANFGNGRGASPFQPYLYITGAIFMPLPLFVILVLLYVLGKKQDGGLWSGGTAYQPHLQQQQYTGQVSMYAQPQQAYQYQQPAMATSPQQSAYPVSPMSPPQMRPNLSPPPQQQPAVWHEMPGATYRENTESKPVG